MDEKQAAGLTHVDAAGTARMVDVAGKPVTERVAEAEGTISMLPETQKLIQENLIAKGDVLGVARIAGILAAKRTSELIPLCHGIALTSVDLDFSFKENEPAVTILGTARTVGQTGVEMEALTAVTVAALTIYDMCKAVDRGMVIGNVRLTYKSGGRSGTYRAPATSRV